MKTLLKLFTILTFFLLMVASLVAQTNSGSITMTDNEWEYDSDYGDYYKNYTISVSPNTPIKINCTFNTFDNLNIFTNDNGIYKYYMSLYEPTNGTQSATIISSTDTIYISLYWGYNTMNTGDTVFEINYSVDPSYTILSTNPSIIQNDQYIGVKLGIGVQPKEKLDVNGSAIINNKLTVGSSSTSSDSKFYLNNNTDNYSQRIYNYKSSTSSTYGLYSYASNYSGNVYGIYSSVSGQTGKKWAGYFYGDVEIDNGVFRLKNDMTIGPANKQFIFHTQAWYPNDPPKLIIAPKLNNTEWDWTKQIILNNEGSILISGGKLGVGTNTPSCKLDVVGKIQTNDELIVTKSNIDIGGTISLANPAKTGVGQASVWRIFNMGGIHGNSLQFWAYDNTGCPGGLCNNRFTITDDGKVGIGTNIPDEKLTVNGIIHAKEIKIDLTGPLADFVFKPSYQLMPLREVEMFVRNNNHLPGIPSATEVQINGLNVGDMQNKLLQKIEELTLYIIEQDKKIKNLEEKLK